MRRVCYAIVGRSKMWESESCVSSDMGSLREGELEYAREVEPSEDYRIVALYTRRRKIKPKKLKKGTI